MRTLEELYLQATRAAGHGEQPQQHTAAALCSLQEIEAAELAAALPEDATDGGAEGRLLKAAPPQQLVPALQEIAALQRERDALAKQVHATLHSTACMEASTAHH